MKRIARIAEQPLMVWVFRKRFMKFGAVGASGVVVNLSVLYLCQEFLFVAIQSSDMRLNVSLAAAIFCATGNNFFWNRAWTWRDRKHHSGKHLMLHFGQYALACWVGIVLQVLLTKMLTVHFYYLVANLAAIAMAGGFNFLVNNLVTFRSHKPVDEIALPNIPERDPDSEKEVDRK